jgi:hypothetical protein
MFETDFAMVDISAMPDDELDDIIGGASPVSCDCAV